MQYEPMCGWQYPNEKRNGTTAQIIFLKNTPIKGS